MEELLECGVAHLCLLGDIFPLVRLYRMLSEKNAEFFPIDLIMRSLKEKRRFYSSMHSSVRQSALNALAMPEMGLAGMRVAIASVAGAARGRCARANFAACLTLGAGVRIACYADFDEDRVLFRYRSDIDGYRW